MKKLAIVLSLILSACSNPIRPPIIETEIQANTDEERVIRMAAITVWASEVAVDRVLHFDTTDAPMVLKVMEIFSTKLIRINRHEEIWVNTMIYEVGRIVALAAEQRVRKRVLDVMLSGPVTFLNARRALDFSGKSAAVFMDVEHLFDQMHAKELTTDQVWDILLKRLTHNIERLRPFVDGGWMS